MMRPEDGEDTARRMKGLRLVGWEKKAGHGTFIALLGVST